jgi:hypothetical protein
MNQTRRGQWPSVTEPAGQGVQAAPPPQAPALHAIITRYDHLLGEAAAARNRLNAAVARLAGPEPDSAEAGGEVAVPGNAVDQLHLLADGFQAVISDTHRRLERLERIV